MEINKIGNQQSFGMKNVAVCKSTTKLGAEVMSSIRNVMEDIYTKGDDSMRVNFKKDPTEPNLLINIAKMENVKFTENRGSIIGKLISKVFPPKEQVKVVKQYDNTQKLYKKDITEDLLRESVDKGVKAILDQQESDKLLNEIRHIQSSH